MSGPDSRLLKALGERAHARAEESRKAEAQLDDTARSVASGRIVAALEGRRATQPASPATRAERTATPWSRVRWAAAIAPLAAAAALALWIGRAAGPVAGPGDGYVVSVTGRVQTERAANGAVFSTLEARAGSVQQVIVRPAARAGAPVVAKVLVVRAGVGTPVDVATEVSEAGVVRFDMPGALLLGASEVRVAIAPAARLAATVDAASATPVLPAGLGAAVVQVPVEAPKMIAP